MPVEFDGATHRTSERELTRTERDAPSNKVTQQVAKEFEAEKGWLAKGGAVVRPGAEDGFTAGPAHRADFDSSPAVPLEPKTFLEPGAHVVHGVVVHNEQLAGLIQTMYTPKTLEAVERALDKLGTLRIDTLPNGLPRAADVSDHSRTAELGYDAVWTRDTAFIAEAWRVTGEPEKASKAMRSLVAFYARPQQLSRLKSGIDAAAAGDVAWAKEHCRPHIRFDGPRLAELAQPWGHHQNDALGLFLKETFTLAREGRLQLDDASLRPLALMAGYLKGIDYTTDHELGHWEEAGRKNGKVSASTLRCVLAGLQEMRRWAEEDPKRQDALQRAFESQVGKHARGFMNFHDGGSLDELIARGTKALNDLLPFESKGDGVYRRPTDLALTTALYLDQTAQASDRVITAEMRREIIGHLKRDLRRSHGDIRYPGDGYWAAYPKLSLKEVEQMNMKSLEDRQAAGIKEQGEAQWTLGAPIESVIHGQQYQRTHDVEELRRQVFQLNRALGMITGSLSPLGAGVIPESYFLVRATHLDHADLDLWTFYENGLPLNWAKAYVRLALHGMRDSLAVEPTGRTADPGPQGPVREVLARWSAKDDALTGSVLLEHAAKDKPVKIVYSVDGWKTVKEATATLEKVGRHGLETWSFRVSMALQVPEAKQARHVDFVVKCDVKGAQVLGNNGGRFFSLDRGD